MADTASVRLALVKETTFGEQVTGSDLQTMRMTSESLKQDTTIELSKEIRQDRQISDVKRTKIGVSGSVNAEMSYGSHDELMTAALLSAGFSSAVAVGPLTTISAANSDNSFNDSANGFGALVVGQWVKSAGFATAANNGYFKIESVAAGKIVVSGSALTDESVGPSVTVTMGAQIVNGVTLPSYNIEKQWTDLSNKLALFTGMCVDTFDLDINADGIVTLGFGFIGSKEESKTSSGGTGYTAATTTSVLSAIDDIAAILEAQAEYDTTAFSMSLANNLRSRLKIGNLGVISVGKGIVKVSGKHNTYFDDDTVMNKYLNFTSTSVAVIATDGDGNTYVFDFPLVRYTDGPRTAGGQSQDVMADMSFEASMHSTELITIRIVKFPAA